jgi:hypothetical protein
MSFIALNVGVILLAGTFECYGQRIANELKDKRITIKMDHQPLGKVFRTLIVKYNIAIGFEESTLDKDHNDYEFEVNLPYTAKSRSTAPNSGLRVSVRTELLFDVKQNWISVNLENAKLEDVFDVIVRQMKNYKWTLNGNVVNIFPTRGRDKRYEELLNLHVKDFSFKKDDPVGLIRTDILSLPEIKNFLNERNINVSLLRPDPENLMRPMPSDAKFSDLTFRDLLNEITNVKRGGWILKSNKIFRPNGKEFIEIEI